MGGTGLHLTSDILDPGTKSSPEGVKLEGFQRSAVRGLISKGLIGYSDT